MPFESTRAKINLSPGELAKLETIAKSRTESMSRIERAKILLAYYRGETVSSIARTLKTNRPKVERHISKALDLGVEAALEDLPRKGKPQVITPEARAWVVSTACQKPKDLGYSYELWTTRLLAEHIRKHCLELGFDCLAKLSRGTVSKILSENKIKPHKIQYYLERRDPEFDQKMIQVLHVYKEVQIISEKGEDSLFAYISYDEKPGIQAIENTAPDLPPLPGKHATVYRDHEYVRHGTLSLLAGIDLVTGEVIATVEDKHRSQEVINFLKNLIPIIQIRNVSSSYWITIAHTLPRRRGPIWLRFPIASNLSLPQAWLLVEHRRILLWQTCPDSPPWDQGQIEE